MHVVSWNLLFIEYEKKYCPDSKILREYPNDEVRLRKIVEQLTSITGSDTVICLQECNIFLLSLVIPCFIKTHDVFHETVNKEVGEYIITIVPKNMECVKESKNRLMLDSGLARGYLVVSSDKYRIVNCHLPPQFTVKNCSILDTIKTELEIHDDKLTIIAGDFNSHHKDVQRQFGDEYTTPYYGLSYKRSKSLDHIVVNRVVQYKTAIVNTDLLSDHYPISLTLSEHK